MPVIGLVQFGVGNEADRFTYLPQIGLAIALAWTAADACGTWRRFRPIWALAATCGLMILLVSAWRQTGYWRDSETLWNHTLACTSQNSLAHYNLGFALAGRGRIDEAMAHYQKALEIKPDYAEVHNNLGFALAEARADRRGDGAFREGPGNRPRLRPGPQQPRPRLGGAQPHRRGHGAIPEGPGNQARLCRRPHQSGHCLDGAGPDRPGASSTTRKPWKSRPTMPRPTSIWALP